MTTLKLEHPAVAALREVVSQISAMQAIGRKSKADGTPWLDNARSALAASAAYDEAVGECVAGLKDALNMLRAAHMQCGVHHDGNKRVIAARAALAKIAKLGER